MKAVIYARYSSDNQREESIEGQLRECTAFAEKNDITVLRHYIDRAYSAKTDNRPEFQHMIKDSSKHLFDMVIVWKLDRFSRNRYDSARYKTLLKRNGVKVVSATEVISEGAEGIILESVLEGFAEYYSADLAEKVGVTRATISNMLQRMERDGLVTLEADKEDARSKKVRLTQAGNAFMQKVLPPHYLRVSKLMERLTGEEQRQVIELLHKLTDEGTAPAGEAELCFAM